MAHDDLERWRPQIRRFLEACGVDIKADGAMDCPNPDHLYLKENAAVCGERFVECGQCAVQWDVFDVCGLIKGMPNTNATFPKRIQKVKEMLEKTPILTVISETPIAEMSAEELSRAKAAMKTAAPSGTSASEEARKLTEKSIEEEQSRRKEELNRSLPFRILGRANGDFYFIGAQGSVETAKAGAGITKEFLYLLADSTWWEREFHGGRQKIDMDSAKFFLISESNARSFDVARLRGRGAWREE